MKLKIFLVALAVACASARNIDVEEPPVDFDLDEHFIVPVPGNSSTRAPGTIESLK